MSDSTMPVGFFERLRWLGRLFLLLFVLGAAAFLSAITAMRFAIEGRVERMPELVGSNYALAVKDLQAEHLGIRVVDHAYSPLAADSVVRQSPPPGTEVKVGQLAEVVLSLGPEKVSVPSLIDQSLPAARLQLLTVGLQLGEVSYIYSAGEPADLILQQHPLPGQTGVSSPRVSVLVSLGPRPAAYLMPPLDGMQAAAATKRLTSTGLPEPTVTAVADPGAVTGSVVAQTPAAGARVDAKTPVVLEVASPNRDGAAEIPQIPGAEPGGAYARMRVRRR